MRRKRRICVVTGTRAEYGLLRSTMAAVRDHPRLELQLAVTGMHLLRRFGMTADDVLRDGWTIDARVQMQKGDDSAADQALGLSRGVAGLARFFAKSKPDVVVVLGDRVEALAGALAGATTGRLVAHIHGGDIAPGDFDNSIRDAITKLTHVHFAATRTAARRILSLGEDSHRVHVVGAPGLDELLPFVRAARKNRERHRYALILQHPCGRSAAVERKTMSAILRAVQATGLQQTILYPNSDRGHSGILQAIHSHHRSSRDGSVRVIPSLPREEYLRQLSAADVLVGNSSSGIIEAATAGTPAVNVGDRQAGRERSGRHVFEARESVVSVRAAIRRALRSRPDPGKPTAYGTGKAGQLIVKNLSTVRLDAEFRRKQVVQ